VKDIEFSFGDAMLPQQSTLETAERLRPEIINMANAVSEGYEGDLASLCLPDDRLMLGKVRLVIGENLQLKSVARAQYWECPVYHEKEKVINSELLVFSLLGIKASYVLSAYSARTLHSL